MILKKRLVISNTAIFVLPVLITIIASLVFIFISSNVLNTSIGYGHIKKLAEYQYELFSSNSSLIEKKPDMLLEKDFQEYISSRFYSAGADMVALKGNNIIFSTTEITKIDIEKCLNASKNRYFSNSISLNNIPHILRVVPLVFKDGSIGNAIFLAPMGKEGKIVENFLLFVLIVFLASFLVTNLISSIMLSKKILNPLERLKRAAGEISCGNLAYEIIEDGDDEIRGLCNSFEQMRLKLKESVYTQMKYDENRKMLVSSISHDLRTPITSIKGYVNGILDGIADTPEKVEKYLKTVYSKASQIDAMIDDLLLYSKLDLSQVPFNFEKTDIEKYFKDCILECSPELEKSKIQLKFENKLKDNTNVLIDREKLRRVINNIIDNACKYMNKPEGKIVISLREAGSNVIIEVQDNGTGIRKEHLNHIFDRFYRADSARSKTNGSGLGLAIAKQIVEGHNGKIWATSRENEGTSIMISLKKLK